MVLPVWHHNLITVAIPVILLPSDSGGSNGEAVQ